MADVRTRPTIQFVRSRPAHFIAFGFGSGLAPVAPGTAGTIAGFALYYVLASILPDTALLAVIGLSYLVGIWACGVTGRRLGVHDHGGIVWDEIAAIMLVLFFVPKQLSWQIAAIVLFRFFDIVKPPPIGSLDRRIGGGFGVMLDDLVAALYTLLCLAIWQRIQGG